VIVDAHHHVWDPARADYPWLTDDFAAVRRAFTPDDLAPVLAANGVDATVMVQTRSSVDETRELLATAAATPFIRGVVGWVDLTEPGVADTIAELRAGHGGDRLVGIRHQVQDEPDPDWLLRDDVERGIRAVGDAGLVYDLLVRTPELPAALTLARRLTEVRFVIDHLAKPPIREQVLQPWADRIRPFGELEHVACKLSGMVTEADWQRWRPADLAPYVAHVLAVFGPRRLLFGSDWPMCLVAATYDQIIDAVRVAVRSLDAADSAAVFGGTAIQVYGLRVAFRSEDRQAV
jgi:L-fucono-1,5-lactonase